MRQTKNIYQNLQFQERPYDQNAKFSVYIPKSNDKIMQLLQKERLKSITQKQQTQQIQIDTMDHSAPSFPNQTQSQTNLHSTNAENNKVKQRLMYDIQQARAYQSDYAVNASMPPTTTHQQNKNNFFQQHRNTLNPSNNYADEQNHQSNSEHTGNNHFNVNGSQNFNLNNGGTNYNRATTAGLKSALSSHPNLRIGTAGLYTQSNQQYRPHFQELPAPSTAQSLSRNLTQSQTFSKLLEKEKTIRKLTKQLYFDERTQTVPQTTVQNQIIQNIIQDGEIFLEKKQLLDSIYKLKQLNLLQENQTSIQKLKANNKFSFVYNDFHTKATNNGYSRQPMGGYFFTR